MTNILIALGVGYALGIGTSMAIFLYGVKFTTKFIYRIKEDVPLEEIGKPTEQDYTGG